MELRQFNPMNERFKALHCLELITLQTYLAYCCDIEAIKKLILDSKLSLSVFFFYLNLFKFLCLLKFFQSFSQNELFYV